MKRAKSNLWRRVSVLILLCAVILPVLVTTIWYWRQVRQQRLDHALIEAIKKNDTPKAISLLDQGADANSTDKPYQPITLNSFLIGFWNRMRGNTPPRDTK